MADQQRNHSKKKSENSSPLKEYVPRDTEVAGDRIEGYVAPGAEEVVIGKNIIQNITKIVIQIGALPMLILGLLLAAGVILVALYLNRFQPMPSGFNIAVAQFAAVDQAGRLAVTSESEELSDWLFDAIKKETDQLPASIRINLRRPSEVGVVSGGDRDARAEKAKEIAARHNASILIYGVVTTRDGGYQVEPEFYVADESFGYGSEVAGPDRLGQPVPFEPPLSEPGTLIGINEKLDARTKALQHLVKGLADFYVSRYDEALGEFREAANIGGWSPEEGKEVVHLLIGAALLRLYDPNADLDQRTRALQEASNAFAQAYQLNPGYARSYLGLGSVSLQQATLDLGHDVVYEDKLIEAYGWYSKSLSVTDQPVSAYVPIKAAYGLGQIHLVAYEYRLPGWSADQARQFFEQIIAAYQIDRVPDLAWFAAHAHAYLGRLAGLDENWGEMASEFRMAIEILDDMPGNPPANWIAIYWSWVGFAESKLNRPDAARNAYQKAVTLGTGVVTPEKLAEWQAAFDGLNQAAP